MTMLIILLVTAVGVVVTTHVVCQGVMHLLPEGSKLRWLFRPVANLFTLGNYPKPLEIKGVYTERVRVRPGEDFGSSGSCVPVIVSLAELRQQKCSASCLGVWRTFSGYTCECGAIRRLQEENILKSCAAQDVIPVLVRPDRRKVIPL